LSPASPWTNTGAERPPDLTAAPRELGADRLFLAGDDVAHIAVEALLAHPVPGP